MFNSSSPSATYMRQWIGPSSIDSDNGLLPDRRQTITRTNAHPLSIRPIETNFGEILIYIQIFSFKKLHLSNVTSSAKWRTFCPGKMSWAAPNSLEYECHRHQQRKEMALSNFRIVFRIKSYLAAMWPNSSAAFADLPFPPITTPTDDVTMSIYGNPLGVWDVTA